MTREFSTYYGSVVDPTGNLLSCTIFCEARRIYGRFSLSTRRRLHGIPKEFLSSVFVTFLALRTNDSVCAL